MWLRREKEGGDFHTLDDGQLLKVETAWRAGKKEVEINSETVSRDLPEWYSLYRDDPFLSCPQ